MLVGVESTLNGVLDLLLASLVVHTENLLVVVRWPNLSRIAGSHLIIIRHRQFYPFGGYDVRNITRTHLFAVDDEGHIDLALVDFGYLVQRSLTLGFLL